MVPILINPCDETKRDRRAPATRLDGLAGKRIALLNISKPGGTWFLDRTELLLKTRYGVADTVRETKPTYTKKAPTELIERLIGAGFDAVVEALAD